MALLSTVPLVDAKGTLTYYKLEGISVMFFQESVLEDLMLHKKLLRIYSLKRFIKLKTNDLAEVDFPVDMTTSGDSKLSTPLNIHEIFVHH